MRFQPAQMGIPVSYRPPARRPSFHWLYTYPPQLSGGDHPIRGACIDQEVGLVDAVAGSDALESACHACEPHVRILARPHSPIKFLLFAPTHESLIFDAWR